jgi:addiction module HigA family antidote
VIKTLRNKAPGELWLNGKTSKINAKMHRRILLRRSSRCRYISRQHLHDIMEEKEPLSPEVAVRVGKLFGAGPGAWVRMQAAYDTWHAERNVDVSDIPTVKVA